MHKFIIGSVELEVNLEDWELLTIADKNEGKASIYIKVFTADGSNFGYKVGVYEYDSNGAKDKDVSKGQVKAWVKDELKKLEVN